LQVLLYGIVASDSPIYYKYTHQRQFFPKIMVFLACVTIDKKLYFYTSHFTYQQPVGGHTLNSNSAEYATAPDVSTTINKTTFRVARMPGELA
jgi:hypothetical protein